MQLVLLVLLICLTFHASSEQIKEPVVQFSLQRRGGPLALRDNINLTFLSELVCTTEARYTRTVRQVKNNQLARKWSSKRIGTAEDVELVAEPGQHGRWYFDASVGDPPQVLQFDIDMLSNDFYTSMTTSGTGSKYNSFSNSHVPDEARVHPLCKSPTELLYIDLGGTTVSTRLMLPMCSPSKSSIYTMGNSGNVFGLAPSGTLARMSGSNALEQLFQQNHIHHKLFSLTLGDGKTGNLTLGGSIAREIEEVKTRFQVRVDNVLNPLATPDYIDHEVQERLSRSLPATLDEQFRWLELKGAEGWWTTLMGGVWINGAKVLQDQAVLLDIQSPFTLAPPEAARRFYKSIHASKRLSKPNDNMFVFPCHNRPNIAFEFARWIFPTLSGDVSEEERLTGPLGGRFSLGKLRDGSGYCVGAVVETRVGETCRNCGMKNMWVIGDPFFRGTGIVFDVQAQRIGFRTY